MITNTISSLHTRVNTGLTNQNAETATLQMSQEDRNKEIANTLQSIE